MFGIRKPRSTRKIIKEKDVKSQNDDLKLTAFSKIFKGISLKQVERFFTTHDINQNIFHLNEDIFISRNRGKYFSDYKIYEEISKKKY
jgi:hypothetical protein